MYPYLLSPGALKTLRFQRNLFLEITTLVTWLKSILLLKKKCFDTHIYMKTKCLITNKMQHSCERKCLKSGMVKDKGVALIKFNLRMIEKTCLRRVCKRSIQSTSNLSADTWYLIFISWAFQLNLATLPSKRVFAN